MRRSCGSQVDSRYRMVQKRSVLFFDVSPYQPSAPGGTRTPNPWFRRPVLYPLSYGRVAWGQNCGK